MKHKQEEVRKDYYYYYYNIWKEEINIVLSLGKLSILKISMEGDKWQQCDEDATLNIPLVAEYEERQISGSGSDNNIVTTSFLKTCFNGLNALSGNITNLGFFCFA